MEINSLTKYLQRVQESIRIFRDGMNKIVRVLRNEFRYFARTFKTSWAKHVVINGTDHQRRRAMIFLQTRNRRMKRKQWSFISQF